MKILFSFDQYGNSAMAVGNTQNIDHDVYLFRCRAPSPLVTP